MRKLLTTILIFSLYVGTYAQMEREEETSTKYLTNVPVTINPNAINITGSAYENDAFVLGNVFRNEKLIATNVALRYNALRDEFEVKPDLTTPDTAAKIMMRNPEIYVKINSKVFIYADPKDGMSRPGYFLVLFEGENADLFKKISREFVEGMAATTSLTRDIPSTYKEKEGYFLFDKKTNSFKEFLNSKSAKFALFNEKKKELKNYSKNENLNINRESSLIKLVEYYNTL
ncbi:MAG: hypothetical protein R2786_00200 [Flavobacteriaceae bacterium]